MIRRAGDCPVRRAQTAILLAVGSHRDFPHSKMKTERAPPEPAVPALRRLKMSAGNSRVISTMQIDDHGLREDAAGC